VAVVLHHVMDRDHMRVLQPGRDTPLRMTRLVTSSPSVSLNPQGNTSCFIAMNPSGVSGDSVF
jgi:hypothetical protein